MIRLFRNLFGGPTPAPAPIKPPAKTRSIPNRPVQASAGGAITPVRHYFEALNVVDHRTPIPAGGLQAQWLLNRWNRAQIAGIARFLWDNAGQVFYATDLIANYSAPMIPRAATLNRQWNEKANNLFDDWATRADYTGRFDFWDLQRMASYNCDIDGEGFALWVTEEGLPQLQLIDAWRIDKPTSEKERVVDGVQLDASGRVTGYWLDSKTFLPVNQIVHILEPDRVSAFRGISPMRRGSNDMRDATDIKGFQKILSKLSTVLSAVIQGGAVDDDPWGTPEMPANEGTEDTTDDATTNAEQRSYTVADLIGGDIPTLEEGQELKQVNTPVAPANNIDVISYLAGCFVAGLGLPPAFFLDEKLTGPNQRAVNGKAQRKFDRRKATIGRLARGAWLRVMAAAIERGDIAGEKGWDRCDFIGPSKMTIDAGREMAQERDDVAAGLMTRRDHYGNRGRSWRRETDQIVEEIDYILERCAALSAEHGIPMATIAQSFGIGAEKTTNTAQPLTKNESNDEPDQTEDGDTPD